MSSWRCIPPRSSFTPMSYSTYKQCVVARLQLRAVAARCKYDWLRLQGAGGNFTHNVDWLDYLLSLNREAGWRSQIDVFIPILLKPIPLQDGTHVFFIPGLSEIPAQVFVYNDIIIMHFRKAQT